MTDTIEELKRLLDNAKDDISSANSYADDAESAAGRAEDYANQAYDTISTVEERIEELQGYNSDDAELLADVATASARLTAALALKSSDKVDGSLDKLSTGQKYFFRNLQNLLLLFVRINEENQHRTEVNESYMIDSSYNTDNELYVIRKTNKEETNG